MMKTLEEFISYLIEQIGQPYLWGGQHTALTPANYKTVIHKKESGRGGYTGGPTYEEAAIDFCEKKFKEGYDILYAYDCSGLGMYWLQNVKKLYRSDMNANTMMSKCELTTEKPKKGYWVFRLDGNRASHIGYMINDQYLVEAKGRKYGVVKTKFKAKDWAKWGVPLIFKSQIVNPDPKPEPAPEPTGFVFRRILKYGCRGEDVKELKQLLYEAGYKTLTLNNPNYLSRTVKVVKEYQKANGLKVDGQAGPQTIGSLGGIYIK